MSSKELWKFIFDSKAHPECNTLEEYKLLHKQQFICSAIGEIAGMFFVLMIYGTLIYFFVKIFYPIKFIHAVAVSFLIYITAKLFTIPFSKKNSQVTNNYYNDNNEDYEDIY